MHPDKIQKKDENSQNRAKQEFQTLGAVYRILGDTGKSKLLDISR